METYVVTSMATPHVAVVAALWNDNYQILGERPMNPTHKSVCSVLFVMMPFVPKRTDCNSNNAIQKADFIVVPHNPIPQERVTEFSEEYKIVLSNN